MPLRFFIRSILKRGKSRHAEGKPTQTRDKTGVEKQETLKRSPA